MLSCQISLNTNKRLVGFICEAMFLCKFSLLEEKIEKWCFDLLFVSQYLLTEDYMRQREAWAEVNIQR